MLVINGPFSSILWSGENSSASLIHVGWCWFLDLDFTAVQVLFVAAGDISQHYQPCKCHGDKKIPGIWKVHRQMEYFSAHQFLWALEIVVQVAVNTGSDSSVSSNYSQWVAT